MSDKRFILNSYENSLVQEIRDTESDFRFSYEKYWIDTSLVDLLNSLAKENEKLQEKLNVTALELVDEVISMGKAVEISEMDYHEFLKYREKKGKPMELQL